MFDFLIFLALVSPTIIYKTIHYYRFKHHEEHLEDRLRSGGSDLSAYRRFVRSGYYKPPGLLVAGQIVFLLIGIWFLALLHR